MTEATHQMTSNPLKGARKVKSVGIGHGVQVAILDTNNLPKGVGELGEVCVKGPNVTSGTCSKSMFAP